MNLKLNYKTLLYLFPALLVFIVFNVLPGMTSLLLSFFEFSGFATNLFKKFVGWKNFIKISNDKYFWIAPLTANVVGLYGKKAIDLDLLTAQNKLIP